MMEVVSLFKEKTTVDNMGLGSIRDTFSDLLFPGTSVLFTRARYLLFVPWLCLRMEAEGTSSTRASGRLQELEVQLITSLVTGEDASAIGIIGRDARENLKQFPSAMYWNGLRRFGILVAPVTRAQYLAGLDRFHRDRRRAVQDDESVSTDGVVHNWRLNLPAPPDDFLDATTVDLTAEEAGYLTDRIVTTAPQSLTAHLLQSPVTASAPFPWSHPAVADLAPVSASRVDHARRFSELMNGSLLVYNLLLAEEIRRRRARHESVAVDEDKVDEYREELRAWAQLMNQPTADLDDWDARDFWDTVQQANHRVPTSTQRFVDQWRALVQHHGAGDVADADDARDLVRTREFQMKGSLARLANPRALERWNGDAGSSQLAYRWETVGPLVKEIVTAREPARA